MFWSRTQSSPGVGLILLVTGSYYIVHVHFKHAPFHSAITQVQHLLSASPSCNTHCTHGSLARVFSERKGRNVRIRTLSKKMEFRLQSREEEKKDAGDSRNDRFSREMWRKDEADSVEGRPFRKEEVITMKSLYFLACLARGYGLLPDTFSVLTQVPAPEYILLDDGV